MKKMDTEKFEEKLIEKGYTEFKPSSIDSDAVTKCFQKRFDDSIGKKYFITIKRWDFPPHPYTGEQIPTSYEYESQLYEKDTHEPINISHFGGWKVDKVEAWYRKHWNNEDYDYYERWDEC